MQPRSETHDVFISYSSKDREWADATLKALEELRVRCWIAPRDVVPGTEWPTAIVAAIAGCRVMVLIFSRHSNASKEVPRELTQAAGRGVHVLPLRIDDVQPSNELAYFLGSAHWLTVLGGPTPENLAQLQNVVSRLLQLPIEASNAARALTAKRASARKTWSRWVAAAVVVVGAGSLVAWRVAKAYEKPEPVNPPKPLPFKDDAGKGDAGKNDPHKGSGAGRHEPNGDPVKPEPAPAPVVPDSKRWKATPAALQQSFAPIGDEWSDSTQPPLPLRIRQHSSGIEFVLVHGGKFVLGSEPDVPDTQSNEYPTRTVELSAFYIARQETTQSQFLGSSDGVSEPVVDLTYEQAEVWCEQRGLSLPTEAEWEYAASGRENRRYPWGDAWNARNCNSNNESDRFRGLAAVGSFPEGASWCGAEDLAGNAAEWCQGWIDSYAKYSTSVDPRPPTRGDDRAARGGNFTDSKGLLRTSHRRAYGRDWHGRTVGFRCVFRP